MHSPVHHTNSLSSEKTPLTEPKTRSWYHAPTHSITHLIICPVERKCALIDPVLDYDPASGHTHTTFIDEVMATIRGKNLQLEWILETHTHADHLTAAEYVKRQLGGKTAIGKGVLEVMAHWHDIFGFGEGVPKDGSPFDCLFEDREKFTIGTLKGRVMATPGHTPCSLTYYIQGHAYVGDTLFMPDSGTARADFPGGDAEQLYRSIMKIFSLPPTTKVHVAHDYQPGGREPRYETTIEDQRQFNIHIHTGMTDTAFVETRTQKDATLNTPALMLQALQVNLLAGQIPADENGQPCLKIPLNRV